MLMVGTHRRIALLRLAIIVVLGALLIGITRLASDRINERRGARSGIPARSPAPDFAGDPVRRVVAYRAEGRRRQLPPVEGARVAGIDLGSGTLWAEGRMWASVASVRDPVATAARLADAYPRTGLWPLLWSVGASPPTAWYAGSGRAMDPRPTRSPGGPLIANPFRIVGAEASDRRAFDRGPYGIALVAAPRPADVVAVANLALSPDLRSDEISYRLRRWEDLYGAHPVMLFADGLLLAADRPPVGAEDRASLSSELSALVGTRRRPLHPRADTGPPGSDLDLGPHLWRIRW